LGQLNTRTKKRGKKNKESYRRVERGENSGGNPNQKAIAMEKSLISLAHDNLAGGKKTPRAVLSQRGERSKVMRRRDRRGD